MCYGTQPEKVPEVAKGCFFLCKAWELYSVLIVSPGKRKAIYCQQLSNGWYHDEHHDKCEENDCTRLFDTIRRAIVLIPKFARSAYL